MKWTHKNHELISQCRQYKITNELKKIKGGNQYCLWKYQPEYACHNRLVTMGTIDKCRRYLDEQRAALVSNQNQAESGQTRS